MTIAHVLSSFGEGGQERVALELARLQRAAGHEVHAISLAPGAEGPIGDALRQAGAHAVTIEKRMRVDPLLPLRIAEHLRRYSVDIVHTHNPHALIYAAPAALLARVAIVHSRHGMNPDSSRRTWLRRAAGRLVDAYVAVTPSLAVRTREDEDCDSDRLSVIPNGIDVARFAPNPTVRARVRSELGIPDGAWVVGTVGRLAREKDQATLIDAMAPFLGENCRLVIAGDGDERDALADRVRRLDGERFVSMLGRRTDVEEVLAAFDVFALSSRTEGLPLVLLEAMATGLPVVSTAVGGVPDLVVHGETGLLVPSGDAGRLSSSLASLRADADLSRRLGEAGRAEVLHRYSADGMARRYETLYARVIEGRRDPFGARAREARTLRPLV